MTQIYLRSPRPDGYWEGVEPGIERPDFASLYYGKASAHDSAIHRWQSHLASLPVLHLIHPDLGKANGIGWLVKEWEEGYERAAVEGQWKLCTKEEYDEQSPALWYRKIIVGKKVEAQANYHQVVPDSHYWDSIDSLINYLSYQKARAVDIDYLITGFKNSLKNGYDICPSQPAENNGQEEGKEFDTWLKDSKWSDPIDKPGEFMVNELRIAFYAGQAASRPVTDEAKEIERLKARVKELEGSAREVAVGFDEWAATNGWEREVKGGYLVGTFTIWSKEGVLAAYTTSELFDIFIEQNKKG